jgi:serine/threonine protein kinase
MECIYSNSFLFVDQSIEVTRGLQYLHTKGIIHGDLRVVCWGV